MTPPETLFCATPAPLTHILLECAGGSSEVPERETTSAHGKCQRMRCRLLPLSQGLQSFVPQGPWGEREAEEDIVCGWQRAGKNVCVQNELHCIPNLQHFLRDCEFCTSTLNERRLGMPKAPAAKASHNQGLHLRPVTKCYTIHMLQTSRISSQSKPKPSNLEPVPARSWHQERESPAPCALSPPLLLTPCSTDLQKQVLKHMPNL